MRILVDINECLSNPCDINAVCEDVRGSFDCRCNEGYSGNGLTCLSKFTVFVMTSIRRVDDITVALLYQHLSPVK